jgi:hypothetical protein
MKEGRVIRVDHLVYTTPEKAFSKIDVDAVMRIIESVMNAKDTIVDADIFREYVNIELKCELRAEISFSSQIKQLKISAFSFMPLVNSNPLIFN